jgi:hypothetical protein
MFHIYIFGRRPKQYIRYAVSILEKILETYRKGGWFPVVSFRRLNVDDYQCSLPIILVRNYREQNSYCLISYSFKLRKFTFLDLLIVYCLNKPWQEK